MLEFENKIKFVLIIGLIVFTLLFIGILFFILQFSRTKTNHLEELMKTKLEIQDETLSYIGRELHDNLGQLLTVAKIHINSLVKQYGDDKKIAALNSVLDNTIVELRALSKSLNNSRIQDFGLHKELIHETERIGKLNGMHIGLHIEGEEKRLAADREIILYRIIQEFISNALKYAQATELNIALTYQKDNVQVDIAENGIGFDMSATSSGSGVVNIKNRARLLNADPFLYESNPGKGTQLSLTLPL